MNLDAPTKSWQSYTASEIEQHYNPRASVPDSDKYGAARAEINVAALASPTRVADVAYGSGPLENMDFYVPEQGHGPHPVHIFIHGGYWRSREKEDFAFIGAALARAGLMAIVINYPLCKPTAVPAITLDDVVAGTLRAFKWVRNNIADHGGDPVRITLSGHSAGGHLGAAIIAHDWSAEKWEAAPLQGAVLVSGIYDPHPTQHISVNAEIGITPELAATYNMLALPPHLRCPVHVIVGGGEPEGWIAQSADYARYLRAAGTPIDYCVTGMENHFSIQDQFATASADVLGSILKLAGK